MPGDDGSFWFKSSLFGVEPGEDKEINPGIYGKVLARWLADRLKAAGYSAEVINEDWGRCIMCQREPVWLWVGCANIDMDYPEPSNGIPKKEDIIWHCFVTCEVPFLKRIFKKVNPEPGVKKLAEQLADILNAEPAIQLVPEP